jgi:hypothetical protein
VLFCIGNSTELNDASESEQIRIHDITDGADTIQSSAELSDATDRRKYL